MAATGEEDGEGAVEETEGAEVEEENQSESYQLNDDTIYIIHMICIVSITIYLLTKIWTHIEDIFMLGIKGYFQSHNSLFELLLMIPLAIFIYMALWREQLFIEDEFTRDDEDKLRILEILIILENQIQLFRNLKTFDFFAEFVRSFVEIIKDAA